VLIGIGVGLLSLRAFAAVVQTDFVSDIIEGQWNEPESRSPDRSDFVKALTDEGVPGEDARCIARAVESRGLSFSAEYDRSRAQLMGDVRGMLSCVGDLEANPCLTDALIDAVGESSFDSPAESFHEPKT
jgi:hypothetical protein